MINDGSIGRGFAPPTLRGSPQYLARLEDIQPNGSRSYRFWQRGGGYDRNLSSTPEVHRKLRYIHENPVRRGLVQRTIDWRWSSALAWETGTDEPLSLDRTSFPPPTFLDEDLSSDLLR